MAGTPPLTTPDNLPRIADTDTPDVPRDMNALADATQVALLRKVEPSGVVAQYANAAALPATATDGQMAYVQDINSMEVWSNGRWLPMGGTLPYAFNHWEGTVTPPTEFAPHLQLGSIARWGGKGVTINADGSVTVLSGVYTVGTLMYIRSHTTPSDFSVGYGTPSANILFGGTAQRQDNGWWQSLLVFGMIDTRQTGLVYCPWSWGSPGRTVERCTFWINWMGDF